MRCVVNSTAWLLFSLLLSVVATIYLLIGNTIQALVLLLTQTTNALFNSQYNTLIILANYTLDNLALVLFNILLPLDVQVLQLLTC